MQPLYQLLALRGLLHLLQLLTAKRDHVIIRVASVYAIILGQASPAKSVAALGKMAVVALRVSVTVRPVNASAIAPGRVLAAMKNDVWHHLWKEAPSWAVVNATSS